MRKYLLVKGKTMMKHVLMIMLSFMLVLSSFMSITALAASVTSSQDGLVATLATDKDSYDLEEAISISLLVENTNLYDVKNVTTEIILPSGVSVVEGTASQGSFTLLAGESSTNTITAIKEEYTVTSGNVATDTGDDSHIIIWGIIALVSLAGLLFIAVRNKKLKNQKFLAVILALIAVSVATPAMTSSATTLDDVSTKSFTVSKTILIDGEEHEVLAKISYDYFGESESDDTVTVSFNTGLGSEVSDMKVLRGESLGIYPYTSLAEAEFNGWYKDPGFTIEFDCDEAINESMTLYADFTDSGTEATLYETTEMFLMDQPTDFSFTVYSEEIITADNLANYVNMEEVFGASEATGQAITYKVYASGNCYTITAVDGYTEGGFYKANLASGVTLVSPDEEGYNLDVISILSFMIYKEESSIVEYVDGVTYLQVDESSVLLNNTSEEEVIGTISITYEDMETIMSNNVLVNNLNQTVIEDGDILILMDGENTSQYGAIKITDIKEVSGFGYTLSYVGCEYADLYSNVDVATVQDLSVEDMLADVDTAAMAAEIKESEGVLQLTYMLAAAIAESEEIQEMGDGSDPIAIDIDALMAAESIADLSTSATLSNTFSDNVYFNDKSNNVALDIAGLYEGLEVSVEIGQMSNNNFTTLSRLKDECFGVNVEVQYGVKLDNGVYIQATINITESFVGVLAGSGKSYDTLSLDFNYYVLMEAETDVDFEILICSAEISGSDDNEDSNTDDGNSGGDGGNSDGGDVDFPDEADFTDISESITETMSLFLDDTELEDENENIITRMQELLENEGEAIELFNAPIAAGSVNVYGLFDINIYFNFVVKMDFAAGLQTKFSYVDSFVFGIEGSTRDMSIDFYSESLDAGGRYSFDFYAAGYIGVKAGIESEISISLPLMAELGEVGAGFEVGAYVDLYGYLHYNLVYYGDYVGGNSESLSGGIYLEMGIYLDVYLFARSNWFDVEAEWKPVEEKFALFSVGNQYVFMQLADDENAEIDEEATVFLQGDVTSVVYTSLPTYYGEYLDITSGEVVVKELTGGYYSLEETIDIPYVYITYVKYNDNQWVPAIAFSESYFSTCNNYYAYYGVLKTTDMFGITCSDDYYVGEMGDQFAENISIDISYMAEQLLSPSINDFRDLGTQVYTWIADGFTGYGETYTATFAIETDDGLVELGSREVINGRVTGSFDVYESISDELKQEYVLDSYTYYDSSLKSYVTETAYTWNIDPTSDCMTEDTTYILTAEKRQSYVGYVYFEDGSWTYDVLTVENGESPVINPESGEDYTFTGLTIYDCNTSSVLEVADVNHLSTVMTVADVDYRNTIYGGLGWSYSGTEVMSKVEAQFALLSFFKYYEDASIIYVADYDFPQYKVTYETNDGDVIEYVDYNSAPSLTTAGNCGVTGVPYQTFLGWDVNGDGEVDYERYTGFVTTYSPSLVASYEYNYLCDLPISNEDVTYTAIYSKRYYTLDVYEFEGETHSWEIEFGAKVEDEAQEAQDLLLSKIGEIGFSENGDVYSDYYIYLYMIGESGYYYKCTTEDEILESLKFVEESMFLWGENHLRYIIYSSDYYNMTIDPGEGSFDEEELASINESFSEYYYRGATVNEDGTASVYVSDYYTMEANTYFFALVPPESEAPLEYYYQFSHWEDQDGNKYSVGDSFPKAEEAMTFTPIYEQVYLEYEVGVITLINGSSDTSKYVSFTGNYQEYLAFVDEYTVDYAVPEDMDSVSMHYEYEDYTTKETDDGIVTYIYLNWTGSQREYEVTYTNVDLAGGEDVEYVGYGTSTTVKDLDDIDHVDADGNVTYTNEFLGWDIDDDGEVDYYSGSFHTVNVYEDMEFVAVWQQTCTITFYYSYGPVYKELTGVVGEEVTGIPDDLSDTTTKVFVGWSDDIPTTFTTNMTLDPVYETRYYTVTFDLITDGVTATYDEVKVEYNTVISDIVSDTVETAQIPTTPDQAAGKVWDGWRIENIGTSDFDSYKITDDLTVTGTLTSVYVIYTVDGVEDSREIAVIGDSVTVADKLVGYADWIVPTSITVTDGTFTMPSSNVTISTYKNLDGTLSISDGTDTDMYDATSHEASKDNVGVGGYTFVDGVLNVTADGLTISGEATDVMIIVEENVTELTLSELTVVNTEEKTTDEDVFPEILGMESQDTINTYALIVYGQDFTLHIEGIVDLKQEVSAYTESQYNICYMPITELDEPVYDEWYDKYYYWTAAEGTMTIQGGEESELLINSTNKAVYSFGSLVVNALSIESSEWTVHAVPEYDETTDTYIDFNGELRFNNCDITIAGGIYSYLNVIFNDCNIDISDTLSVDQSEGKVAFTGDTNGTVYSDSYTFDGYEMEVDLNTGKSVTISTTSSDWSAIRVWSNSLNLVDTTSISVSDYQFSSSELYDSNGECVTEIIFTGK